MTLLLWAAALYRVSLSVRHEKTVWRTAFTVCTVSVALGATFSAYGDQTLDRWLGVWNLSALLTHLALIVTAASTSIYVATLRRTEIAEAVVRWRLAAAGVVWAIQIGSWASAPVHTRQLEDFSAVWTNTSVCVFNLTFVVVIIAAATETGSFCLTQAASRNDLTRTISLTLTGTACLAGAAVFTAGGVSVVVRYATGSDVNLLNTIFDTAIPYIMVVLALGTLSLLIAPPLIDFGRHYQRWRSLKPLWEDLIDTTPEVHLDVPVTGGPRQRIHLRVQRAIVEIHDALRLTRVPLPLDATVEELGRALHSRGSGSHAAADVLDRTETSDDDIAQLLTLARSYTRSPA